jgi:hypothetical protein
VPGTNGERSRGDWPISNPRCSNDCKTVRGRISTARGATLPPRPPEQPRYERYIAAARKQEEETTWEAAWTEGSEMSVGDAIRHALKHDRQIMEDERD